jgi:hypothetical protein
MVNAVRVCHQYLKKKESNPQLTLNEVDLSTITKSDTTVKEIPYKTARALILQYEWLGTMPAYPWKQYGLFAHGKLIAVECFATIGAVRKHYSYLGHRAICLARGASISNTPGWVGSYLISQCLMLLEKEFDYAPMYVLAYSDWEAGELGTVYQASNWVYTGHRRYPEWISPDGERKDPSHHRNIARYEDPEYSKKRKLNPEITANIRSRLEKEGWKLGYKTRGRYVIVIGRNCKAKKELIAKLKAVQQPYLKREDIEVEI